MEHDLLRLAAKMDLSLTEKQKDWLDRLTSFNINTRYDSYKQEFYNLCTKEFALEWKIFGDWSGNGGGSQKSGVNLVTDETGGDGAGVEAEDNTVTTIESKFTIELNDSLINYDLRGLMILDSLNFVNESLHKQNEKYKGAGLANYVSSKYQQNIVKENDSISSLHFIFSAPLFNKTKTSFIIYFITVFNSKDTLGWSHQYALCEKRTDKWEYIGAIEIARDRVLNSVE